MVCTKIKYFVYTVDFIAYIEGVRVLLYKRFIICSC
jgi:hypothetical protein